MARHKWKDWPSTNYTLRCEKCDLFVRYLFPGVEFSIDDGETWWHEGKHQRRPLCTVPLEMREEEV